MRRRRRRQKSCKNPRSKTLLCLRQRYAALHPPQATSLSNSSTQKGFSNDHKVTLYCGDNDQKVTAGTKFTELGADSLDTVEIVVGLEEEFGITMEEERGKEIATVQQDAELIEELVQEKAA